MYIYIYNIIYTYTYMHIHVYAMYFFLFHELGMPAALLQTVQGASVVGNGSGMAMAHKRT